MASGGATAQISEVPLMPVLQAMLAQFPFHIWSFHSDNGSEIINHTVAEMPNKLLTKNGCVIRKHIATRPVIFD